MKKLQKLRGLGEAGVGPRVWGLDGERQGGTGGEGGRSSIIRGAEENANENSEGRSRLGQDFRSREQRHHELLKPATVSATAILERL